MRRVYEKQRGGCSGRGFQRLCRQLRILEKPQAELKYQQRIQRMKQGVGQVKSKWPIMPDATVNDVAKNKQRSKKSSVLLAPGDGEISVQDLADLDKVVREKITVEVA